MKRLLLYICMVCLVATNAQENTANSASFISASGGIGMGLTYKGSKYVYMNFPLELQLQGGRNHILLLSLQPTITSKKVGKTVHLLNSIMAYNYQFNPSSKVGLYLGGGAAYSSGKYLTGKISGDNMFKKLSEFNQRSDFEWGLYTDAGVHFHRPHAGFNIRCFAIINSSSQIGFSLITTFGKMLE